jgi:hypothetical protein
VSAERGLCGYLITRGEKWDLATFPPLRATGAPGLVRHGGLALVVTEVDVAAFGELDAEPAEDSLLAQLAWDHDAIVRAVFEHEPVLPLRFGTIVANEDSARRLLAGSHADAADWLDRVAGHREWGVRVGAGAAAERAETPLTGLSGANYLRTRQQSRRNGEQVRERQAEAARVLHAELAEYATGAVQRASHTLLDAAYLVPQANEQAFLEAATALYAQVRECGATVHATGPWPPYSFTRTELAVTG